MVDTVAALGLWTGSPDKHPAKPGVHPYHYRPCADMSRQMTYQQIDRNSRGIPHNYNVAINPGTARALTISISIVDCCGARLNSPFTSTELVDLALAGIQRCSRYI